MRVFIEPIAEYIWRTKYRYSQGEQIIDQTIDDTWRRVADAIASVETLSNQQYWRREFYRVLSQFQFLPGGRILAGAGTQHRVTLFNCFVMTIREDSLPAIFEALQEGALTLQQGGGVGYDFSVLRPAGDIASHTGVAAAGPVSFMQIWDAMCATLISTGARRGAMMGILRCDHPDIEAFVTAKADAKALRHFNLSVMVSDAFMQAVKDDAEWALVFPTDHADDKEIVYRQWGDSLQPIPCRIHKRIRARDLWEKITRAAYAYAEPGVLFGDTINRNNNLYYAERIHATNPCGEIPLPAYGACDLGAINLTKFVIAPFTPNAQLNWQALEEVTSIATRFLDNVIDVSHYPLLQQEEQARNTRRIGLGMTGLADVFVMLGLQYGSAESLKLAREIMQRIANVTWRTSMALAKEKGVFPLYNAEQYLQGEFVTRLDPSLQRQLAMNGVRNSHHNTIAPAGTISLLANNISNGIEPIFSPEYTRYVRTEGKESLTFTVQDYAYRWWQDFSKHKTLPPAWVDANSLPLDAHLQMQAVLQPFIDNAISKTINLPRDFPFEKLSAVYTTAYELGLKGCTIFRPNDVTGSVLEMKDEPPDDGVGQCCCRE